MNIDGSFVGEANLERAGIGFHSSTSAQLIPDVLDPKGLSQKESRQRQRHDIRALCRTWPR